MRSIESPASTASADTATSAAPASVEAVSPGDTAAAEAVAAIRAQSSVVPAVAIILGSGLGPAADLIEQDEAFSFADLPGFPAPTVPGHAGRLLLGTLAGVPVAAFMGRIHFYEGHPMSVSAMPVRVARLLGAGIMVLTASVGALDPALKPGSLVVATDHLNMMGENPLRGWRNADGSPPFIDVSSLYDPTLRDIALAEAPAAGLTAAPGVYVAASGPSYETRAEIEMMRNAGGTVVGMSIVPEALPARALGMRLLGLFSVTNSVGGEVSHLEVIEVGRQMGANLAKLLERVVPRIAATTGGSDAPH
ncbi:MAG TPA: purine-nucleoside phosphorylase [Actinomycetota bacterium]|jgi:purine-nucleoside phosphorylase